MKQSNRFDSLANLPFEQNRPTPETAKTLMEELAFQQATQAYLWAMPLINTLGMKFGSEAVFGAGYNILPVWKERLDPKTLVTTPNSDVIYAMSYVDMGETGPIVFEAPPNLQGILLDFWQRPIPVDGGKFFGDVACRVRTRARAGNSSFCRRAMMATFQAGVTSTAPARTIFSSSCAPSTRIRTIFRPRCR